jgi:hypothetical protein
MCPTVGGAALAIVYREKNGTLHALNAGPNGWEYNNDPWSAEEIESWNKGFDAVLMAAGIAEAS